LQQVFSFLNQNSKLSLRCTCTRWFYFIDYRDFVIYFTRSKKLPEIAQVISRYKQPLSIRFTKTIELTPEAINHLSILTNITSLSFDCRFQQIDFNGMPDLTRLTTLHHLQFRESSSPMLLKSLTQLTRVDMLTSEVSDIVEVLQVQSMLRQLEVTELNHFSVIQNLSHLTSLVVHTLDSEDATALAHAHNLKILSVNQGRKACPLPFHALTALEKLKLYTLFDQPVEHLRMLTRLKMGGVKLPTTSNWTLLTRLKSLWLADVFEGNMAQENLYFLTALSRLSEINILEQDMSSAFNFLPRTLTKLYFEATPHSVMDNISRFTALQRLTVSDYSRCQFAYYFLTDLANLTQLKIFTNEARYSMICIEKLTALKIISVDSYEKSLNWANFNLSKLPNLEVLRLPSITTHTFASLSTLSKIKEIDCRFSFACVPDVLERLPLKTLRVSELSEEFWPSLVRVTTLELLSVSHVDSEEKIILLTALQHLTSLGVYASGHLPHTCFAYLSNLQQIRFPTFNQNSELKQLMPYLYS
jgi:hypothetical protein